MTVASIATAFLLFSLGRSVAVAFTNEVDYAGKDRLVVSSKLSFTQAMPMAYANRIEAIEGVDQVAWRQWFGGTYICLLYTSPSPRDQRGSRMPSSA